MSRLFKFSVLCSVFMGAHAWFFWDARFSLFLSAFLSLIALIYGIRNRRQLHYNKYAVAALVILSIVLFKASDGTINGIIGQFAAVFPLYVLLGCSPLVAKENLHLIQKVLMYILVPSIILHLILLVVHIPPFSVINMAASERYVFNNYFILVKNEIIYPLRFSSIFLEPGYLGTFCAFLLYVDDFDFSKRCNKVILCALIVSLSLAGWLTTFLAYILYNVKMSRRTMKRTIAVLGIVVAAYLGATFYNNGDNVLNNMIFERISYDKDKGIKGNNRFSETTDLYYEWVVESGKFWTGIGSKEIEKINEYNKKVNGGAIEGAGYKIFILNNGFLLVLYYIAIYILLALSCPNRKYAFIFFGLICITFIQAAYPLSMSWLVPLCIGLKLHEKKTNTVDASHKKRSFIYSRKYKY